MALTIDQVLAELRQARARLSRLPAGDPARPSLEARVEELREAARRAADASRHPVALRRELDLLVSRLESYEKEKIKPAWIEHRQWLNDPSAYSHEINEKLDAASEHERAAIVNRISEITEALAANQSEED